MAAVDPLGGRGVADLRDIIQLVEEDLARVEEIFEAQFRSDVGLVGEIGRYIHPAGPGRLPDEWRDAWHAPWVFLLIVAVVSVEWALRRQWGLK